MRLCGSYPRPEHCHNVMLDSDISCRHDPYEFNGIKVFGMYFTHTIEWKGFFPGTFASRSQLNQGPNDVHVVRVEDPLSTPLDARGARKGL